MPVISFVLEGHIYQEYGSQTDHISAPPAVLDCGRTILLVFRLFSDTVAPFVVVDLLHLWKEVNSGFSYFVI